MSTTQQELKQQGNSHFQKKEFEKAIELYTLAIEEDAFSDEIPPLLSNRSLCYYNIKKFDEALQDAQKAISLRPTWPRGYQRAITACEKLEKYEEGLKNLEKCFELDKQSRTDPILKELKDKLTTAAVEQKISSMNQQELKQQGNIHFQNNNFEKAIEFYTLAIEKDAFCDEAAPILSNRSLCFLKFKKYKEAYEDAGCCCGIRPDWAKGFARRGFAAEELKEWQIAFESYDEYLKLDPKDEMGVQPHHDRVKKIIDCMKRDAKQYQIKLRQTEQTLVQAAETKELKKTTMSRAFNVLLEGCRSMSIEMIELAVKFGADLSMPFLFSSCRCCSNENRSLTEVAIAQKRLDKDINDSSVQFPVSFALRALKRTIFDAKNSNFDTTTLLVKQRNFLDRLLDVIDKQDNAYTARSVLLHDLFVVCAYDETRPIRKDLVLILLEKGKKCFIGEKESDRDWRRVLLSGVLSGVTGTHRTDEQETCDGSFFARLLVGATTPVSRSIYECVQLLLEGLTAHDLNNIPKCVVVEGATEHLRLLPIQAAAMLGLGPAILQLLINAGATANEDVLFNADGCKQHCLICENEKRSALGERRIRTNILQTTFELNDPASARILLKNEAQPEVKEMPKWAIDAVRDEQNEFPDLSIMDVSEKQCTIFQSVITAKNSAVKTVTTDSEETLRLLFDVLADQNLSVYWAYSSQVCCEFVCENAFSCAIARHFPVDYLRTLITIRPKLLHSPSFEKDQRHGQLIVTYPFGQLIENCLERYKPTSLQWVLEVAKFLFEEGDLNYYTTIAHRQNLRSYFHPQNRSALIERGDLKPGQPVFDTDGDPQSPFPGSQMFLRSMWNSTAKDYLEKILERNFSVPRTAYLLSELRKYCEDYYERRRANEGRKREERK